MDPVPPAAGPRLPRRAVRSQRLCTVRMGRQVQLSAVLAKALSGSAAGPQLTRLPLAPLPVPQLLEALLTSSLTLMRIIPLIIFYVKSALLASTERAKVRFHGPTGVCVGGGRSWGGARHR